MNIFEFYMKFKTDAAGQASEDIKKLDKQIAELAAKGKKRSEDETKEYQLAKKQRADRLKDTKEYKDALDKVNTSFQDMVNNAVGAVTAYTSFSFFKNALIDANNLNLSLKNLQSTFTGLDATQVEKYARAAQLSGVSKEAFYAFVTAQKTEADSQGRPFNLAQSITSLRRAVGTPNFERGKASLPGVLGITPFLRSSDEEFQRNLEQGGKSSPTQADLEAAKVNNAAVVGSSQRFNKTSTEIDTAFSGAVKDFSSAVQLLLGALQGHPYLAAGAEGAAALGTGYILKKIFGRLLNGSAGAAVGVGAGIGGGALTLATLAAAAVGATLTWGAGAAGEFIGGKLRGAPSSPQTSSGGKSRKQQILDFWQSKGYTPGQAAGFAANAQAESSFGTRLLGYDGKHFGLYQWSSDRRKKILDNTGIDVATAPLDQQLAAAAWETNSLGFTPDRLPKDSRGAAAYLSTKYEVPSTTASGLAAEATRRADIASGYGDIPFSGSAANNAGGGRTINVKIDDVKIETQASDAAGIAGAVAGELKNQIRMAIANIDDGLNA